MMQSSNDTIRNNILMIWSKTVTIWKSAVTCAVHNTVKIKSNTLTYELILLLKSIFSQRGVTLPQIEAKL